MAATIRSSWLLSLHVDGHVDDGAVALRASSVLASRPRMLLFSSARTAVNWFSMPGRSSVWTTIFTGKDLGGVRAHSTSILRSTS